MNADRDEITIRDLQILTGLACTAVEAITAGQMTDEDLRAALHAMRSIINRAERRLDSEDSP